MMQVVSMVFPEGKLLLLFMRMDLSYSIVTVHSVQFVKVTCGCWSYASEAVLHKWISDTLLMLWMHIGTPSEWRPCHNAIRLPEVFSFWFQPNSRPVSWLHDVVMHINCFSANFILGASKKFYLNTLLITDRIASFRGLRYSIFPFKGVTVHWNRITVWSFLIATLSNTLCHSC